MFLSNKTGKKEADYLMFCGLFHMANHEGHELNVIRLRSKGGWPVEKELLEKFPDNYIAYMGEDKFPHIRIDGLAMKYNYEGWLPIKVEG